MDHFPSGAPKLFSDINHVILITTLDKKRESLVDDFVHWWEASLDDAKGRVPSRRKAFKSAMKAFLSERISCRRLEVHDLPNSVLLHVVMRTIEGAGRTRPRRVVIEDLSTWREIYPDIKNDPLFLPALLFHLKRVGAASLIIDSHAGRPDATITDPFDSELRAMVDHHLYMWRVHFFGESRIAISAIPPMSSAAGAAVRELTWSDKSARPSVDIHFENYSGIEEGHPEPVPLKIRLLDESPAVRDYIQRENRLLNRMFVGVNGEEVVTSTPVEEYEALHDATVLAHKTRMDHTLIVALDEFWRGTTATFRDQAAYLLQRCDKAEDSAGRFKPSEDAPWPLDKKDSDGSDRLHAFHVPGFPSFRTSSAIMSGRDYFHRYFEAGEVDRVPFMWDFGFLMCRGELWDKHSRRKLEVMEREGEKTVGEVWKRSRRVRGRRSELRPERSPKGRQKKPQPITWRDFLGACKHIARDEPGATAFDLGTGIGESLSCLVLEVWMSEVFQSHGQSAEVLKAITQRSRMLSGTVDFKDIVERHVLELYRATLLLIDVLPIEQIVDPRAPFRDKAHGVDPLAVASRQWYKSAVNCQSNLTLDNAILREMELVRLPGHFSTRGDWHLGVAKQSRSYPLANEALDHLTSRRANHTRLQMGVGLPVRHFQNQKEDWERMHTALVARTESLPGRATPVTYGQLASLGASSSPDFQWLWRSKIRHYGTNSGLWHRWLRRMFLAWVERRSEQTRRGLWPKGGGHAIYDVASMTRRGRASLNAAERARLANTLKEYEETQGMFGQLVNRFTRAGQRAERLTQPSFECRGRMPTSGRQPNACLSAPIGPRSPTVN